MVSIREAISYESLLAFERSSLHKSLYSARELIIDVVRGIILPSRPELTLLLGLRQWALSAAQRAVRRRITFTTALQLFNGPLLRA
jgi:hypothetical protein